MLADSCNRTSLHVAAAVEVAKIDEWGHIQCGHVLTETTWLILRFAILLSLIDMSKRLSSREFLELADILWQGDVKVKYQNPDNWTIV